MSNNKPDFIAYSVKQTKEGQRGIWTAIGSVWRHRTGEGFDVVLNAIPLDGRVVCMPPKMDEQTPAQ